MVLATDKVTKVNANGAPVTLTARVWLLLADAYRAAGIDVSRIVVTKGSYVKADAASGTTHVGGGAFDLRVWNIPQSRIEPLVVELRKRNVCAWKRDAVHGGFDPHIHGIVRDEPDLSGGAEWQVSEYDAGRDGLKDGKADYHPRPVQHSFTWIVYPGKPIGWNTPFKREVAYMQDLLHKGYPAVKVTGTYVAGVDDAFRAAVEAYQRGHLTAFAKDRLRGVKFGGIGQGTWDSIVRKYG